MSFNVQRTQHDFGGYNNSPSEVMSLDQMMSNKARTMGISKSGEPPSTLPVDDGPVSILPVDDGPVNGSPVAADEVMAHKFVDKMLDGTIRSRAEISQMLKDMAKDMLDKAGFPQHKQTEAKINALCAAIVSVRDIKNKPNIKDPNLLESLQRELNTYKNAKKLIAEILDRMIKPTKQNGGLDMFGRDRKEWWKHD